MKYNTKLKFMSADLRCELEGGEECLLVDVSALVPGGLAQTQRLPHCVLDLELGLDHLGGVQRVGVSRAPVILNCIIEEIKEKQLRSLRPKSQGLSLSTSSLVLS